MTGGGFIAGSIIAKLLLDKTGWNQAIGQVVGPDAAKLKGSAQAIGQQFKDIGQQMTQAGVGLGIFGGALLGAVTTGVKAFATFDAAMTESLAIMGDVSETMRKDLVEAAREVARETTFTSAEAAKAYYYLASAGYTAAEAIQALPVMAKFAQAGMFDLATATSLLADAQSALGMRIRDDAVANMQNMVRVADVLSKANIMANASIEQFSESLTTRAGAALRLVGKDVEEGTAVLAAFADQGVKGAEAGTRLDIVLRDLQTRAIENKAVFEKYKVTVFDTSGEMRNMADVIGDLEKALAGKSDEMKRSILMEMEFSDRSVASILNLVGMSDAIRKYEAELRKAGGTTEKIARLQLQTLNAQLKLTQNAFSGLAASFGATVVPALMDVSKKVRELVDDLAALVREHPKLAAAATFTAGGLGILFTAAAGGIIILGTLLRSLGSIIQSAGTLRMIASRAFMFTFTIVGAVVALEYLRKFREDMKRLTEEGATVWEKLAFSIKEHNPFKGMTREGLGDFLKGMEEAKKGIGEVVETALPAGRNLAALFKPIAGMIFDLSGALKELGLKTRTQLTNELKIAEQALAALEKSAERTPGAIQGLKEKIAELRDQLKGTVTDTRSLKEQFDITFRSETEAQMKRMADALLIHRGKMTAAAVDRLRAEIDKLAGSLKLNLVPAADEVEKHVDRALEKLVEMALKVNSEIESSAEYTADQVAKDLEAIAAGWKKTSDEAKEAAKKAADETKKAWTETTDQMAKAFGEAFSNIIEDGLNFKNLVKDIAQGLINSLATMLGKFVSEAIKDIGNIKNALSNLASSATAAFQAMGAALAIFVAAFLILPELIRTTGELFDWLGGKWDELQATMTEETWDPREEWEKAFYIVEDAIRGVYTSIQDLNDAWSSLISYAKEAGLTSSKWLIDLIRQFREAGKYSKELNEYILSYLDTIPAALLTLVRGVDILKGALVDAAGKLKTGKDLLAALDWRKLHLKEIEERLGELGRIAVTTFYAMIASGKSWIDTVEAMAEPLALLRAKYKELGLSFVGTGLGHLFRIVGITEKYKELFEAIDSTRQILVALGDTVWLTSDAWKTLTGDIVSQFHALRHGGLSVEDSLRAMVPSLQAIVNYAAAYGFELDAQTQSLVRQAMAHGWIKEAQKTEANILVEGFNRVCDILIKIAEVLGADVSGLMTDISTTAGTFYRQSTDTVTAWKEMKGILVPFNESLEDSIALAKKLGITVSEIGHEPTPFVTTTGGGESSFGVSRYQEGGIAWTRQLAEVAEREPEVIKPLREYRSEQRPVNMTFNIRALDGADVISATRRIIIPELQKFYRHGGQIPARAIGGT